MITNPYKWNNCEEVQTEVRESSNHIHQTDFILVVMYRFSFMIISLSAYVSFLLFNSLHTARVLAVVAGTVAILDLFVTLILSVYYGKK